MFKPFKIAIENRSEYELLLFLVQKEKGETTNQEVYETLADWESLLMKSQRGDDKCN